MASELLETLPLTQRLALAYAPARARSPSLAVFALDARLGQSLRQASEPIMAQMRLAWWRDQFKVPPSQRERSDELVRALDPFVGHEDALIALVDGWELLLSEDFGKQTASAFATARARVFLALARVIDAKDIADDVLLAGQRWALADLMAGLSNSKERAIIAEIAQGSQGRGVRLSRLLRPLTVLDGLARRSFAKGGDALLDGPLSALAAFRLGLTGR